jgi:hypothetical protein
MLESTVVKNAMKIASSMGWFAIKIHGSVFMPRGFPDVIFFKGGMAKFVEYKAPGGVVSPVQSHWHAKLLAFGFVVGVIDRAEDTRAFLEGGA